MPMIMKNLFAGCVNSRLDSYLKLFDESGVELVTKSCNLDNRNSSEWTWIKFVDEDGEWCGEFRGMYRGVLCLLKLIKMNVGIAIHYELGIEHEW